MRRAGQPLHWTFAAAICAAVAAWTLPVGTIDAGLHAAYAWALAADSPTQSVVLVDVGDVGDLDEARAGMVAALAGDEPRLVLDAEGWTGCGLRMADGTCLMAQVEGDRSDETGLWIRPGAPVFAALAAIGAAPAGPLSVRYAARLPTVPGSRVAAGEIPAGTFTGRIVVVGRADVDAPVLATPLGPMSVAQIEAQALLGVLDAGPRVAAPAWLRVLALAVWALATAWALRGRWLVWVVPAVAIAWVAALVLDVGLYAGGALVVGAGGLLLASAVAAGIQVGVTLATARAQAPLADAATASGLHKVSGV